MKKVVALVLVLLGILPFLLCCGKQEVTRLGVNAEILEIDSQNQTLKVRCRDRNKTLTFTVNCDRAIREYQVFYADYGTHETQDIPFGSLQVGDAIALAMEEEVYQQMKTGDVIQAFSVQLLTQRL